MRYVRYAPSERSGVASPSIADMREVGNDCFALKTLPSAVLHSPENPLFTCRFKGTSAVTHSRGGAG